MYDNHIFSTKYNGQIIQIIQQNPNSVHAEISAWTEKWEGKDELLVISLKLSSEIKDTLKTIFQHWFVEITPLNTMKDLLAELPKNRN